MLSICKTSNHFCCKFHSGTLQMQTTNSICGKTAEATMKIVNKCMKSFPAQIREHRNPQISMQKRHGTHLHCSGKTIADDEIISFPEGIDKRLQTRKIIAVITIAHNNVSASRSVDPTCQGVPITLSGNRNNTGSHFSGNCRRAICASVICNQDFSRYICI